MPKISEVERQTARMEALIRKIESSADPDVLATTQELVRLMMELYGAGLERITEIVFEKGEAGREILEQFGRDELVGNLLAANGLHPLDLDVRVRRAVEQLNIRFHGTGSIELLNTADGVIRLRARANGSGCGSHATSLKSATEAALYEAAPDLVRVVIEELEEGSAASGFVPLEKLAGLPAVLTNGGAL